MNNTPPIIILMAGKSSRMGTPKGLTLFANQKLFEYQLSTYQQAKGNSVIVIVGANHELYFQNFPYLHIQKWGNLKIVTLINYQYQLGQFSSLLLGINHALQENYSSVLVTPIDVPLSLLALVELTAIKPNMAAIPTYQQRAGHPVLITKRMLKDLSTINPLDPSGRLDQQLIKISDQDKIYVEINDPLITKNINYPIDLS